MVKTRKNNPVLTLEVRDRMLNQFVRRLFTDIGDGTLLVSTRTATGAVICSLAEVTTSAKDLRENSEYSITLMLPVSDINSNLVGKMVYLSEVNAEKVMTVLRREFRLVFVTYIYEGCLVGLSKKDGVQHFIEDYNMGAIDTAFETLAKKHQRITEYSLHYFNLKLRQIVYDTSKKIRKKLRNNS